MRNFLLIGVVLGVFSCMPKIQEMDYFLNQPVNITDGNTAIRASVLQEDVNIKTEENKTYYWFRSGKIRTTQGGVGGKALNGSYEEFYHDKNLKTKGEFKLGLKDGEWRFWYPNGNLEKIENWKDGELHGTVKKFDRDGNITETIEYKKGEKKEKKRKKDKKKNKKEKSVKEEKKKEDKPKKAKK